MLHPEAQAFLDLLASKGVPPTHTLTVADARKFYRERRAITQPALVVSGSDDTMLPADNAYAMFKALSNAQLVLYPDSGHGALFQHHALFVSHVRTFLDASSAA